MFDIIFDHLNLLSFNIVILSIILFFVGYTLAPTIYYRKIRFFLAYPMWLNHFLESWMENKKMVLFAFFSIFFINAGFLALVLLSGSIPVLPMILLIWMGINIGVITYHTLKGQFYYSYLFTPVAILELGAVFITFSMALNINLLTLGKIFAPYTKPFSGMEAYWDTFKVIVIPLLVLAGNLELVLFKISKKLNDGSNPDDEE